MRLTNILQAFILIVVLLTVMIYTNLLYHKVVKNNSMIPETLFEVINVTITAYSPSSYITDSTPFEVASGKIVKPHELEQLHYIAISRDIKERFNLEWGDIIYIGFEIQDTMNKRIKNTIDVFTRNLQIARAFGKQKRKIIIMKGD